MEDEYMNDCEYTNEYSEKDYIMYKICPKNKDLNFCYIGHTVNFNERQRHHIRNTYNTNDAKHYHLKHYEFIRNNGGWDEWEMVEIEQFRGKTKMEARIREQELIEQHNAILNSCKAYISEEQRKELKKQITDKFRKENKDKIKEQTKKYKEEHKEKIAEQMKKYRAEHKQQIHEKTKEYREKNKEKYQELKKIWAEKNKETLKEKRRLKNAELKAEKLKQKTLLEQTPEWQEKQKQIEEEKEQLKKEKRDEYNAQRRLKRLQEKQQKEQSQKQTDIENIIS
jgi:hypothetical protein